MRKDTPAPTLSAKAKAKGTPVRTFRVPDGLWLPAKAKATDEGTTVGAVLLAALERYIGK